MKIYCRLSTWVMYAILISLILVVGFFIKFIIEDPVNGRWQNDMEANISQYETIINKGDLPVTGLEHLQREKKINEYRLEHNIPPIETKSLSGFMLATENLISVVIMFTIIVAARIVAEEFKWGTIKLLLIRPVARAKILLSKYTATIIFAFIMLVVLFIFSISIGAFLFGGSTLKLPYLYYEAGGVVERNIVSHIVNLYSLKSVELLMMMTLSFMVSTVFRSSSLAIGLVLFLMFSSSQIVQILGRYEWVKYTLFANTNLIHYVEGTPIVSGMTMTFSIMMLVIYFIIFNLLSWVTFQKRDITS